MSGTLVENPRYDERAAALDAAMASRTWWRRWRRLADACGDKLAHAINIGRAIDHERVQRTRARAIERATEAWERYQAQTTQVRELLRS